MSLKNINEIQSNDYRTYDQNFLKETLSALANSGQRFGSPGAGVIPTSFKAYDVFTNATISSYSYIQCETHVSVSDTEAYRALYGDIRDWSNIESSEVQNKTYLIYYNIEKESNSDVWNKSIIGSAYLDTQKDTLTRTDEGNYYVSVNTGTLYNKVNTSSYNSQASYVMASTKGITTYTGTDYEIKELEYTAWFCAYQGELCDIYLYYNTPTEDGVDYYDRTYIVSKIYRYVGKELQDYPFSTYNIYKITKDETDECDLDKINGYMESALKTCASNNIITNTEVSLRMDAAANALFYIINKKGTSEYSLYYDTATAPFLYNLHQRDVDILGSLSESVLSDVVSSISSYNKENIKKLYVDTLNWNIAYDYVSSYISDKSIVQETDYIVSNTYFSPEFGINVFSSTLDSSVMYCTSSNIEAEYCTNTYIYNTINNKVIGASENNQRYKCVVADWTDIDTDEYDGDYRKFDVYDRNVLIGLSADYYGSGTLYGVTLSNKYVLPYINKNKYWCINGEQTPVSAVGYNADQPSIIIIRSNDGENSEVLTTLHKNDILPYTVFDEADVTFGNEKIVNISFPIIDVSQIESDAQSGNTKADILKFVKSAVIMSIRKSDENISSIIKDGYITTFWVYSKEDDKFVCIKTRNNGGALDLATMSGVYNIVDNSKQNIKEEPDKFLHYQLVFNAAQIKKTKNTVSETDEEIADNIVGAIQNLSSGTMFSQTEADKYGMLPYVQQDTAKYNVDEKAEFYISYTSSFAFYDNYEYDESTSKIKRGSVILSTDNPSLGLSFDSDNRVLGAQLYKYNTKASPEMFAYTNSYIPTGLINTKQPPITDMSSVLQNHTNVLNRINILSIGKPNSDFRSNIYTSYIGTSFESTDKSKLVIGTGSENTDVSRHVVSPEDTTKFTPQNEIDVNFNTINLNGTVKLPSETIHDKPVWTKTHNIYTDDRGNNYDIYSCVIPVIYDNHSIYMKSERESNTSTIYLDYSNIIENKYYVSIPYYLMNLYDMSNVTYFNSAYWTQFINYDSNNITQPSQTHLFSVFAYFEIRLGGTNMWTIYDVHEIANDVTCLYV